MKSIYKPPSNHWRVSIVWPGAAASWWWGVCLATLTTDLLLRDLNPSCGLCCRSQAETDLWWHPHFDDVWCLLSMARQRLRRQALEYLYGIGYRVMWHTMAKRLGCNVEGLPGLRLWWNIYPTNKFCQDVWSTVFSSCHINYSLL